MKPLQPCLYVSSTLEQNKNRHQSSLAAVKMEERGQRLSVLLEPPNPSELPALRCHEGKEKI